MYNVYEWTWDSVSAHRTRRPDCQLCILFQGIYIVYMDSSWYMKANDKWVECRMKCIECYGVYFKKV